MTCRVIRADGAWIDVPPEIESEGGQIQADYEAAAFAALDRERAKPEKVTRHE